MSKIRKIDRIYFFVLVHRESQCSKCSSLESRESHESQCSKCSSLESRESRESHLWLINTI